MVKEVFLISAAGSSCWLGSFTFKNYRTSVESAIWKYANALRSYVSALTDSGIEEYHEECFGRLECPASLVVSC